MRGWSRTAAAVGIALAIAGATVVFGQGPGTPDPGTLAGLTAEVRELRLAVQQLAQTQARTQALGVYLSVQQSRVLHVSSQLDAARKELESVTVASGALAARLGDLEEQLPRVTNPAERNALQDGARGMQREQAALSTREQDRATHGRERRGAAVIHRRAGRQGRLEGLQLRADLQRRASPRLKPEA